MKVFVVLGTACNFKCRHCLQKQFDLKSTKKQVSEKLYERLREIKQKYGNFELLFFGGEPLLYFKQLKEITRRCVEDDITNRFSTITNGSLLTDDIVDFFNAYDLHCTISYDGKDTEKVRNIDVFKDPKIVKLWNKLKWKGIDATISAYNIDFEDLWKQVDAITDVPNSYSKGYEWLSVGWDMPSDLYDFDLEQAKQHLKKIRDFLFEGYKNNTPNLSRTWQAQLFGQYIDTIIKNQINPKVWLHSCGVYKNHGFLNVDLQGNLLICHNCSEIDGKFGESVQNIKNKAVIKIHKYEEQNSSICLNCCALPICHGGCFLVDKNLPRHFKACEYKRIFAEQVIGLMTDIEAWIHTDIDLTE